MLVVKAIVTSFLYFKEVIGCMYAIDLTCQQEEWNGLLTARRSDVACLPASLPAVFPATSDVGVRANHPARKCMHRLGTTAASPRKGNNIQPAIPPL
jgi:hypothetical protein